VKTVDIIELVEALQERERAANVLTPLPGVVSTQQVYHYTNTAYEYDGTPFLSWAGLTNLVTTNDQMGLSFSAVYTFNTGRVIWAGWPSLTATSFDDADANGTYVLAGYNDHSDDPWTSGMVGYYIKDATPASTVYVLRDIQNRDNVNCGTPGLSCDARGWLLNKATVTTNSDGDATSPWLWGYHWDSEAYGFIKPYYTTDGFFDSFRGPTNWIKVHSGRSTMGIVTAGSSGLDTNMLKHGRAPYYETRINAIGAHAPGSNFWSNFDLALTNLLQSDFVQTWSNGVTTYHSVTGLFATLNIGDGTNQFTQTVTNGIPVYGPIGFHLKETNLTERYQILVAMTTTIESMVWAGTNQLIAFTGNVFNIDAEEYDEVDTGQDTVWPIEPTEAPITDFGSPWWLICEPDDASDFTDVFWTSNNMGGLPKGPTFTGEPSGSTTNIPSPGNGLSPRYEFQWKYTFDRTQQGYYWNSRYTWGTDYRTVWARHVTSIFHTQAYDRLESEALVTFSNDLDTNVSFTVQIYALNQLKTNVLATTWYDGEWDLVATTNAPGYVPDESNVVKVFSGVLAPSNDALVPDFDMPVTSSKSYGDAYQHDPTGCGALPGHTPPQLVGYTTQCFRCEISTDTTGGLNQTHYYGHQLISPKALINWDFTRASN